MSLIVANHSSYPRIGEKPDEQRLRQASEKFEKREITEEALEEIVRETTAGVLAEQERAGADLVTDGQVRWADPVSHWMGTLKGVKVGRLLRFFDTNFYYRVPTVDRPLERKGSPLREDLAWAIRSSKRPVKAVLTGPVTLALLSEQGRGWKAEELVGDLTVELASEVAGLAAEGSPWIQIEEPVILRRPEFFPLLSKSLKRIAEKKGRTRILLATYFADAAPCYGKLQDLPVDGLGLDCIYGPGLLEMAARETTEKILSLGVVDGRSTRLEAIAGLVKPLRRLCLAREGRELHLTSSCGLEYLPRARAFDKLVLLARLKELLP